MNYRVSLKGLDANEVLHPDDKSIIEKLNKKVGFKSFVDKTVSNIMERYASIEYSANGINVTPTSSPSIYKLLVESCRILDVKEVPACSLDWQYVISSFSVGEKDKRIVLLSGTIDLLTPDELMFVIGHELGHMKCGHQTYHMLTECLYMPIQSIPDWKLWVSFVKLPLLNWYRKSDFTADRMGLLCCQNIDSALRTMVKMAGLPKKLYNQVNIESFTKQAEDFGTRNSNVLDDAIEYLSINSATMPWIVQRASELLKWYHSGEYQKIINKYKIK